MTELEKLRVQLNQIVDAIVVEAKKQTIAVTPTSSSTKVPTLSSTVVPTSSSTKVPTLSSTVVPTSSSTKVPTLSSTVVPTSSSTKVPTLSSTVVPTLSSTKVPTLSSTVVPTSSSTKVPTLSSTVVPTSSSTKVPTLSSTALPIKKQDLCSHITETFANLLNQPGKDKNILTPYVTPYNWPRNNNCWAKSINLTGYSACVLGLGGVGGGSLITKKHVLLSNHVPYQTLPFTIFFIDSDNVTVTYNVIKTKRVGNTDILIGELDREVDSRFSVFSVLPSNYVNYLNSTTATFPVLYSDQERKALVGEYNSVLSSSIDGNNAVISPPSNNGNQYFESVIGGDSGNVIGTIINNEFVLIGAWYKLHTVANSAVCTLIPAYITQINEVITSFGNNGYKLKEANLSNFYRI